MAQITEGSISDIRAETNGFFWYSNAVDVQVKLVNIGELPITKAYNVDVSVSHSGSVIGQRIEIVTLDIAPGASVLKSIAVPISAYKFEYQGNSTAKITVSAVQ